MPFSLCPTCAHCRTVTSGKGSRFWLCQLAAVDSRFAKYPPQPVVRCSAYAERSSEREAGGEARPAERPEGER